MLVCTVISLAVLLPIGDGLQSNLTMFIAQSLIMLLMMVHAASLWRNPLRIEPAPLDLLLLLFIAICAGSTVAADYRYAAITRLISFLTGFLLYLATRRLIAVRIDAARTLQAALVASSLVAAFYALALWAIELQRARGFFEDPNGFAALGYVGLALVIPGWARGGTGEGRWATVMRLAASGVLLLALVLSESRGGLIGTIVVLLGVAGGERRVRLAIGLLLLVALGVMVTPFRDKLLHPTRSDPLALRRVQIFEMDLRMVRAAPATGVGLGQFEWFSPKYNFPLDDLPVRYSKFAYTAHSDPLQVFAELGVPGGLVFLAILVWPLSLMFRAGLSRGAYRTGVALLALEIHSLVHHLLLTYGLLILWFMLLALLASAAPRRSSAAVEIRPGSLRGGLAMAAVLFAWVAGVLVPYLAARYMEVASGRLPRDVPGAQRAISSAIGLLPVQPYRHAAMADLYLGYFNRTRNLQAFALCIDSLERAESLNPNDYRLPRRTAIAYSKAIERGLTTLEMLQGFRGALEREFRANPRWPIPLVELARLDAKQGDLAEAERKLRAAIALEPNYAKAHFELRKILQARGDVVAFEHETARLREIIQAYSKQTEGDNPYYSEILAVTDEMRRELR
ncbi:MAG: O-antigen ligase family protein [Acidobacteriota bacterium]